MNMLSFKIYTWMNHIFWPFWNQLLSISADKKKNKGMKNEVLVSHILVDCNVQIYMYIYILIDCILNENIL